jgi:hypothetical protein
MSDSRYHVGICLHGNLRDSRPAVDENIRALRRIEKVRGSSIVVQHGLLVLRDQSK